jgi:hypothetical protein
MSIEKTVGSGVPRIEDGKLIVAGTYAKTAHAQMVRELVNSRHVTSTSVTFANIKTGKDATPLRELLNGAFVAVPANPEAIVLSSKAAKDDDGKKPYGDVTYADPGYQKDGKKRYPIDTAAHVRSALSYIGQASNAAQYSPADLKRVRARIRAAAEKFGIEVSDDDDKKSAALLAVFKQLDASGDNPAVKHDDMVQAIHDAAVQLGGQCVPYPGTEQEEEEQQSSNTKSVGSPQRSPDESPADAATKAAASAPAEVPADAAGEPADVATKEALSLRARGLSYLAQKTCTQE